MKSAKQILNERITIPNGYWKGNKIAITEEITRELMINYAKQFRKENPTILTKEQCEKLSEYLYMWMSNEKYGQENILHAAVCCDFVGMSRFKKAIAELIFDFNWSE